MRVANDSPGLTGAFAASHNADTAYIEAFPAAAELSTEAQARQSIDTIRQCLRCDLERHVESLVEALEAQATADRDAAVATAGRAMEVEAERRLAEAVAETARDIEADVERRIADAVTLARQQWEEEHQRAVDEIARNLEARVATTEAAAQQAVAEARRDTDRAVEAAERRNQDAARDARASERELSLATLERLLAGIERLDEAATLRATLDALVNAAAAEAPRVALLVSRGHTLSLWQVRASEDGREGAPRAIAVAEAGTLARAGELGHAVRIDPGSLGSCVKDALPFAPLRDGAIGLAVPVMLGARTVAVLYADDDGAADLDGPGGWQAGVQVLARHASRRIEALTAVRTAELAGVPVSHGFDGNCDHER